MEPRHRSQAEGCPACACGGTILLPTGRCAQCGAVAKRPFRLPVRKR